MKGVFSVKVYYKKPCLQEAMFIELISSNSALALSYYK